MRQVERDESTGTAGPRRDGRRATETDGAVPVPEGEDRRRAERRRLREDERRRTGRRKRRSGNESQTQI